MYDKIKSGNFLTTMLLVLCPLLVLAQTNNYVLTGKVGKLSAPAKAYLIFPAVNHVDSVVIKNGVFEFKGKLQNYYVARLVINEKGSGYKRPAKVSYMSFYIEPGTTKITSPDSLSNAKVTAGKLNADNELLKADFLPYQKRMSSLMDEFFPAPKEKKDSKEWNDEYTRRYNALHRMPDTIYLSFVAAHPNSLFSLFALEQYAGPAPDLAKVRSEERRV